MAEELAGVGYWWMDAATKVIRWSPNMYRIFGLEPGVVPSLDYAMQLVHPDDRAAADANLERNLTGGSARSATRIVQPSGEIRYAEGRSACQFAPDGKVIAVYGTMHDVTDRVAAEKALAESERRYRLLVENATDVTFCFQPDRTITFVTPSVHRLLGYQPAELMGRTPFDIMHTDDRDRVRQLFSEYVEEGPGAEPIRIEFRATTKDGRELWLEAHPRTLFDASGVLIEVQDVIRDITARKQLERDLLAAKEAAEAAAAVKAEFLSNISHELRTPLTAILGYSGLLAETADLAAPARRHIERIEGASRTMLSLVNGLLDFSRLEAGQLTISAQACSPARIARECLDLLELAAEAKGVRLEYFEADGVPPFLLIDPDAYRQVLANLIGNAVKFTDSGLVRLAVEFNANSNQLFVSVEDTGCGIPPAETGKLFRRFSQVDATSTRKHGGAGLGLAICKGLVDAIGGDISILSEPGVGSVFSFRIPATPADGIVTVDNAYERPEAGARILIADDSASIRELARAVLESCGAEVTEAADGAAAIEAATSLPFDLILLDLRMPRMAGQDVAAALRARRGPNANVPIIAFTASEKALDEVFCRQSGFDAVLTKPIVVRDLLSLVARYTGASAQGQAA